MISVFLFFVECGICGIGWLFYESGILDYATISYGNVLVWLSSSYGAMAIICVITVIILIVRTDIRFLCVPIIAESFRWFFQSYQMFISISNDGNILTFTYLSPLCAVSTILLLVLILSPNKEGKCPTILYTISGICRAMYAVSFLIFYEKSPFNLIRPCLKNAVRSSK